MEATPLVANVSTRAMLTLCANLGVDNDKLLSDVGIDKGLIELPDGKIPPSQVFALSAEAHRRTGDRAFALHAAETLPFGAYKLLDYIAMTSATPREGLTKAAHYFQIVSSAFKLLPELSGRVGLFELHAAGDSESVPGHYAEYVLASLLVRFRLTTGVKFRPLEVRLTSPAPEDASEHRRLFQAPVRFSQRVSGFVLCRSTLDLRQPQSDPELAELLNHRAQQLLSKQSPDQSLLIVDIRRILKENMIQGDISLNTIARRLALSRRGLQRILTGHGTCYRDVIDEVRRELTLRLLNEPGADLGEIAFRLRFSEPSAFHRAFKRWTGQTPREYLQSIG